MIDREVGNLIRAIGMMWPTVPVRDFDAAIQVAIWGRVLDGFTYAECEAVVVEHARTGAAFPPAVGVIAERVLTLREIAAGMSVPDADQALAEVMAGIRHGGVNLLDPKRDPRHEWSHPAVAAAVRAMGWRDMCLSDKPDVVRSQFLRVYTDAAARHRSQARRTPEMRALLAGPARPEIPSTTTTTGETHDSNDRTDSDDEPGGAAVLELGPGGHPARRARRRTG